MITLYFRSNDAKRSAVYKESKHHAEYRNVLVYTDCLLVLFDVLLFRDIFHGRSCRRIHIQTCIHIDGEYTIVASVGVSTNACNGVPEARSMQISSTGRRKCSGI